MNVIQFPNRKPMGWRDTLLLYALADQMNRDMLRQAADEVGATIACRKGCAACCTYPVAVWVPEAELIARTINQMGNKQELIDRMHAWQLAFSAWARLHGEDTGHNSVILGRDDLAAWGVTRTPCPFLDTKTYSCGIYAIRPTSCRLHNASNDFIPGSKDFECGCVAGDAPTGCFTTQTSLDHGHVNTVYQIAGPTGNSGLHQSVHDMFQRANGGIMPDAHLLPVAVWRVGIARYGWKPRKRIVLPQVTHARK